jgi:hypothetical protein
MDWKSIVGTVAPTLATALGGPLAGLATKFIGGLFGLGDGASESDVMSAVQGATPDDLLKLKSADNDFKLKIAALGIDLEKIAADDRNSARNREIQTKDHIPGVLAIGVTLGFFALLGWMMASAPPEGSKDALNIMLGALGGAWASVVAYYFGSSAGSAKMKELMGAR